MEKIATHDSCTGEKGHGFLSWLVTPFAKTQSKTLQKQYDAGCKSFDIRVKKTKRGWVCAHGLWTTKRTFEDIITEIASFEDRCQVCVTYEGNAEYSNELKELCTRYRARFRHIIWGYVCIKYGKDSNGVKVKYSSTLIPSQPLFEGGTQGFIPLDGRSWHTYFPVPWLWNKLYTTPHKFNTETFTYVDFL